jgi:hypothetical protein
MLAMTTLRIARARPTDEEHGRHAISLEVDVRASGVALAGLATCTACKPCRPLANTIHAPANCEIQRNPDALALAARAMDGDRARLARSAAAVGESQLAPARFEARRTGRQRIATARRYTKLMNSWL